MKQFKVPGMSCGHCTSTIEKAIKAADPAARMSCDTGSRMIEVESVLDAPALLGVIQGAGYDVQVMAGA
ncbi:heavy-metal-associated domain-containing protein [Roseovarius sp. S1116L3]|uniref:Copper chaperone n=1 Tax=Roseovarius nanhaiticus TaxID=573024 RepID=A0A1N7EW46_9RHOB|nr:heavy-metal-associated domain-containing protein [Roseovarius nanhaiticus]SEK65535.1 copper chaperone [Roseovarius nanhaiticus]SIR92323.1 copper chaperone [Roseovarius nanhaiticus]